MHGFVVAEAPARPAPSGAFKDNVATSARRFKADVDVKVSKVVGEIGDPWPVYQPDYIRHGRALMKARDYLDLTLFWLSCPDRGFLPQQLGMTEEGMRPAWHKGSLG